MSGYFLVAELSEFGLPPAKRPIGSGFFAEPGNGIKSSVGCDRGCRVASATEATNRGPPAAIFGVGAQVLESETTGRILEEVDTETPIVRDDALENEPATVIGASRHNSMLRAGATR